MGMNFNVVQKPKKEDDDFKDEEELELDEDNGSKSKGLDPKKKMIRFMGIIVGIFIIFIIILGAFSSCSNKNKSYSYSEVEKIMKNAAISYFKDNPDSLPGEEEDIVEIDSSNLVASGYMNDLSEYISDEACTGTVQVEKTASGYLYTPYLSCGDSYTTIELANKILENEEVVTEGYGLYSTKYGHVFRGENLNNYVQLDKSLWRIVKITSNNNVVLISDAGALYSKPWDNRYNTEDKYESGINTFSNSRIRDTLNKIYDNPVEKDGDLLLSKKDKKRLVTFNLCVGKRLSDSESKDNSVECSEVINDQKIGLLTLSDYMYASLDSNCKNASTKSCKNYNYLFIKNDWWLITADKSNTSGVYQVTSNGAISSVNAANYGFVRPVIYLNANILYKSGNGSFEKPYKVR